MVSEIVAEKDWGPEAQHQRMEQAKKQAKEHEKPIENFPKPRVITDEERHDELYTKFYQNSSSNLETCTIIIGLAKDSITICYPFCIESYITRNTSLHNSSNFLE